MIFSLNKNNKKVSSHICLIVSVDPYKTCEKNTKSTTQQLLHVTTSTSACSKDSPETATTYMQLVQLFVQKCVRTKRAF